MKISILGYSGSGKSTLAQILGKHYDSDVLHFDSIQFLPGWEVRSADEKQQIVTEFLDTHDSWVIDGNYSKLFLDRRLESSDLIILLLFNRLNSFLRAYKRYRTYKGKTRPDMAQGCNEKFDKEFILWLLWKGRSKSARNRYKNIISQYGAKTVVIKNQRQLTKYIESLKKDLD